MPRSVFGGETGLLGPGPVRDRVAGTDRETTLCTMQCLQVGGPVVRSRWERQRIARVLHASYAVRVVHLPTFSPLAALVLSTAASLGRTGTGTERTIWLRRMTNEPGSPGR